MKKYFSLVVGLAFVLVMMAPTWINAQSLVETTVTTEIGASIDGATTVPNGKTITSVREKLRAMQESGAQNIKNNQETRNAILEKNVRTTGASSTRPYAVNDDGQRVMPKRPATTTPPSQLKERINQIRLDAFRKQQERIVRELRAAVTNLKQISTRTAARIEKAEQNGRNLTEAKALLVKANERIMAAEQIILTLKNYTAPNATSTANTTASSTSNSVTQQNRFMEMVNVDLAKPREVSNNAIEAIKTAKKALNDVVTSIAHAMGLQLGQNASTTPKITTSPTPTVTPTTTP